MSSGSGGRKQRLSLQLGVAPRVTTEMASREEITRILSEHAEGNPAAARQLMSLVYDELRRLANRHMERERPDHSLQATALVHEAYYAQFVQLATGSMIATIRILVAETNNPLRSR